MAFVFNEVMDRRECFFKLKLDDKYFLAELIELTKRTESLAKMPHIDEAYRFRLSREDCNKALQFNRSHLLWLLKCKDLYPDNAALTSWNDENEYLYKVYDNLRDAMYEGYYMAHRREMLGELRDRLDKIDPTWYNQGFLPPPIPVWRFSK